MRSIFALTVALSSALAAEQTVCPTWANHDWATNPSWVETCSQPIAGYRPGSKVIDHSKIDGDQDNMNIQFDPAANIVTAKNAFTVGGSSVKGSGSIRTLQKFSTGLKAKACPSDVCIETMFENQMKYFGSGTYASDIVIAALDGTSPYDGKATSMRKEVAVKGSAYVVAGMYAIHEMEDAIVDCKNNAATDNQDGVHAWDEAVAFYAGFLEGKAAGGNSAGELSYRVAEKRCSNFKTCSDVGGLTGISKVNQKIMAAFNEGQKQLGWPGAVATDCAAGKVQMDIIKKQMLVPLIQGMLRYAFKADPKPQASYKTQYDAKTSSEKAKEIGEGWVFTAAVIGQVNKCNAVAAKILDRNMNVNAKTALVDGRLSVVGAVQCVYECLGVTCADVGGLWDAASSDYFVGMGPCTTEPASANMATCAASFMSNAVRSSVFAAPALAFLVYVSAMLMLE